MRALAAGAPNASGIPGQDHSIIEVWQQLAYPSFIHFQRNVGAVQLNNLQSTLVLDITAPNSDTSDGAFAVYDAGVDAFIGAYEVLDAAVDSALRLVWPFNFKPTAYYPNSSPADASLIRGDRWNRNTIAHEYGHFIADLYSFMDGPIGDSAKHATNVDLRRWPIGLTDSTRSEEEARNLAFRESWPTWFAIAAQQSTGGGTRYRKIHPLQDQANSYEIDSAGSYDMDSITAGFPTGCAAGTCDTGEYTEYLTIATLWDIYDNVNHVADNNDQLSLGPGPIWTTCTDDSDPNQRPDNIIDFWNHWFDGFGNAALMTRVFLNHHMKFIPIDSAPSEPSPVNAGTGYPLNTMLSWKPVVGATSYAVYFGNTPCNYPNSSQCNSKYKGSNTGPIFYLSAEELAPDFTNWWTVVAKSGNAEIAGGPWSFTTGNCECLCINDPECDAVISNAQDLVRLVNVAFRGVQATMIVECDQARTDVNCDGVVNAVDLVRMVNVAFRGQSAATSFCWDVTCVQNVAQYESAGGE